MHVYNFCDFTCSFSLSNQQGWISLLNSAHADGGPRSRVCARENLRSAPHRRERKFSGARVCRVTFKHLPQPGTPSARFRRLDMDGFEYILLNFEYILLNLPRAEVGVTAEKFRRIYSRFRRIYSNSGGYIQN